MATDSFATFEWAQMARRQKIYIAAGAAVILLIGIGLLWDAYRSREELRVFERQATEAKREAEDALKLAAKIAKEKLEAERKLAIVEVKRDEKEKQAADARVRTIDARTDYERTLRERRGDNPSTKQLCGELAALGYPCQ